jgi:hypothetical protein
MLWVGRPIFTSPSLGSALSFDVVEDDSSLAVVPIVTLRELVRLLVTLLTSVDLETFPASRTFFLVSYRRLFLDMACAEPIPV